MNVNLQTISRLPDDLGGPLGAPLPRPNGVKPAEPTVEHRPDGKLTTHPDGRMEFEPNAGPHAAHGSSSVSGAGGQVTVISGGSGGGGTAIDPATEEPGAHGFLRVGDCVRALIGSRKTYTVAKLGVNSFRAERTDGGSIDSPYEFEGSHWERISPTEKPGAHGFMREPLKVGDKVRLLKPKKWNLNVAPGYVMKIAHMLPASYAKFPQHAKCECGWYFWVKDQVEGEDWERVPCN